MKNVRHLVFAALVLLLAVPAWAYDFEVDGICYNITSNDAPYKASVTENQANPYSGNVVIPATVVYENKTYSVTSIGVSAFYGCTGLTSVTIPNSVTSIGYKAFYNCTGLTSVTIPNSVTDIGDAAFSGCTGLTSVTIPNSVTRIWNLTFSGCTGLTSMVVASGNPKYDSRGNCNAIIETETNTLVSGCKTTVIPNSVTSIGRSAFSGCTGLTSVTIGNSVTSIGDWAFSGCTGLTSVTIPNSVTSIGGYAFYGCTGLTSVTIGNSVTSIGDYAFYGCTGLTSLTIGNSLTSIGDYAFYGCTGLTSVTIPNSVTSIGNWAFYGCTGLTSVTIGNSVTSIGDVAFSGCTGLTSMVVASGNPKYDSRGNCNAIIETDTNTLVSGCKTTVIPNSVTSIGYEAFYNCTGLTSVTIPNSVTSIGDWAFSGCTGLTSVTIPNSVTSIGGYAFEDCTGLTSVTIGNSVTSIGYEAFYNCTGLTSVTIPNSVTYIGYEAFEGCTGLTSVTVKATSPPSIIGNTFPSEAKQFYVPCGYEEAYRNAPYWSNFNSIIGADFTFALEVASSDANLGQASITQQPDCENHEATVKAVPIGGHSFKCWMIDGVVVSTSNPYSFVVDRNVEIVGCFSGMGVEEESMLQVAVSPNPTKGQVNIACENMKAIALCTIDGRTIKTCKASGNSLTMEMDGVAQGLYLLRIETGDGVVVNRKIIKE